MKPKILLVSGVIPALNRGGGCMALYRHFVERDDFQVAVASRWVAHGDLPVVCPLAPPFFERRGMRLGGHRLRTNVGYLLASNSLPATLLDFARHWQPDIVFSVADDWHAALGSRLARILGRPFAINFQDLFACSTFQPAHVRPYAPVVRVLLRRYRHWQQHADAVFHTSPGMREWFGPSARGDLLFPLGPRVGPPRGLPARASTDDRIRVAYAGNCYGPYGEMLARLAHDLCHHPRIKFEIYAMGNDWTPATVAQLSNAGIFRGYVPFAELQTALQSTDVLLTAMSFAPRDRVFVQTSFTTKWLDYVALGKPVVVWAPDYASTTRFAREQHAAIVVDQAEPSAVIRTLEVLHPETECWRSAAADSVRLAGDAFHPERIHALLKMRLGELVRRDIAAPSNAN